MITLMRLIFAIFLWVPGAFLFLFGCALIGAAAIISGGDHGPSR